MPGIEEYVRELEEALRPYGLSVDRLRGYLDSLELALRTEDYETIAHLTALFGSEEMRELWDKAVKAGIDPTRILEELASVYDPKVGVDEIISAVASKLGITLDVNLADLGHIVDTLKQLANTLPPKALAEVLEQAGIEHRVLRSLRGYQAKYTQVADKLRRLQRELREVKAQLDHYKRLAEEKERLEKELEELKRRLEEEKARPKPAAPAVTPPFRGVDARVVEQWVEFLRKHGVSITPEAVAELLGKHGVRTFTAGVHMLFAYPAFEPYVEGLKKLGAEEAKRFLDEYLSRIRSILADLHEGRITSEEQAAEMIRDVIDQLALKYLTGAPPPAPPKPVAPPPKPVVKPTAPPKPAPPPKVMLTPREVMEAVKATTAMLPERFRAIIEKIPRGPAGDPGVLLYQAYMSDTLRRLLEQEHPSLAEAIRLVATEIPEELMNYVWYPLSNLFFKLELKWNPRKGEWEFSLKPIPVSKIIDELVKAYRRTKAVEREIERLSVSEIYERYIKPLRELREIQAGLVGPKGYAGLVGTLIMLQKIGIRQGMTVSEADEIYRRVYGKPMPEAMKEVLVRIGYLRKE